ncbi:hypothetical protein B0I37DRAFT_360675 [Chaetomium sp. MPI-CAGE-AT-0009]|nr:hypothetical protein B0I37DRAFT_360675 [Chaetomium sp. MPI-CAGE-AT-0009]
MMVGNAWGKYLWVCLLFAAVRPVSAFLGRDLQVRRRLGRDIIYLNYRTVANFGCCCCHASIVCCGLVSTWPRGGVSVVGVVTPLSAACERGSPASNRACGVRMALLDESDRVCCWRFLHMAVGGGGGC